MFLLETFHLVKVLGERAVATLAIVLQGIAYGTVRFFAMRHKAKVFGTTLSK